MPDENNEYTGIDITDEQLLEQMTQEDSPREVDPDTAMPTTLSDALDNNPDLTDMQFAVARLFPKDISPDQITIGRVAPEMFLAAIHLMSVDTIMSSDPEKPINVNDTYMKNYIAASIGLEGMGRIDLAELAGAAKAEKKVNDLLTGMGRRI